jgi:arylsulfatase A-like enzyme
LLFVTDKPLPPNRLAKIARASTKEVQRLLDVLTDEYRGRGIELVEVAGGYQFRSSAENAPFVRELVARKPVRLTRAQIEMTLDVMATSLDLAGAEKPAHVFFNSLRPLLNGEKSRYESVYGAYLELQRAITHNGWKLIAYPKAKVLRLYRLAEDPQEGQDLAAKPEHAAKLKDLFQRLVKLSTDLHDEVDLTKVFGE